MSQRGDTKEEKKQRKAQLQQLDQQIRAWQQEYDDKLNLFNARYESYLGEVSPKWQYLQINSDMLKQGASLDALGRMAWEMVGVATYVEGMGTYASKMVYVFKRPLREIPPELTPYWRQLEELKYEIQKATTQRDDLWKQTQGFL